MSATALQVAIRPMALDDLPAVMEIERLSFALPWPERSFRFELTGNDTSHLLLAEMPFGDDVRIVGYLGYWLLVDEMHISTLAVHPEMRGRGIGEQLLRAGLEQAWIQGAEMSTLEVRPSNQAAIALYRKHGFELVGRRRAYYQDNNEDALLMTLTALSDWRSLGGGGME